MDQLHGVVIAESLDDPAIINRFTIDKAVISPAFEWPACATGGERVVARWHLYRVLCAPDDLAFFQRHIGPGWFAHFWKGNSLTVMFSDGRYQATLDDRSTWAEAIAHGRRHGIPERMLDFKSI